MWEESQDTFYSSTPAVHCQEIKLLNIQTWNLVLQDQEGRCSCQILADFCGASAGRAVESVLQALVRLAGADTTPLPIVYPAADLSQRSHFSIC